MSSPERERAGRWIAVLVASLALHCAVLVTLTADEVRERTAASQLNAIDVTFTVEEPPPPQGPFVASETRLATSESFQNVRPRRARASEVPSRPSPPKTSPAKVTTSSPELTKLSRTPNLDPAAAARAVFRFQESVPVETREAPRAANARGDGATPDYFEGVGGKRYLSEREPPNLRRQKDGTYHYRAQAFRAIVAKDGSVTFDDRYKQGMTVSFDITDALMRRNGDDPYRYEKQWFLETTTVFREELFQRWRAHQTGAALKTLRTQLLRISEDVTLTAEQKEARVLAIFRSTAEDDAGAAAREAIADFVASRMPGIELSERAP